MIALIAALVVLVVLLIFIVSAASKSKKPKPCVCNYCKCVDCSKCICPKCRCRDCKCQNKISGYNICPDTWARHDASALKQAIAKFCGKSTKSNGETFEGGYESSGQLGCGCGCSGVAGGGLYNGWECGLSGADPIKQ